MKKNRLLAAILAFPLLLSGCGGAESSSSSVSETPQKPEPKRLVTLGDSISFGYGLEHPETERWTALLTEKLSAQDDAEWEDCNYAVSGDDSSDLIERLKTGRAFRLPSAARIVIEIGSNNLLGVYAELVEEIAGDEDLDLENLTEKQKNALAEKTADTEALLKSVEKKLDENLDRLEDDMETIYTWIRERNADAELYVVNIYNPYAGDKTGFLPTEDQSFGSFSQEQIDRANKILKSFSEAHTDVILVDLASRFAECDPVPILGNDSDNSEQFKDPHPTAEGQQIIADTLLDAMKRS